MIMIDWLSKKRSDKKRREAHEQALKNSLADKIAQYESHFKPTNNVFTNFIIDGKAHRVEKEHITLADF